MITEYLSTEFNEAWHTWKEYKREQLKFKYGPIAEKAAKTHLVNLSKGDECTAIAIIDQSIANGWKGFFELKKSYNGFNTSKKESGADQLLARAKARFNG